MIRVYRFHDKVAVNPPDGPTFYLSRDAAQDFAIALQQAAYSVQSERFTRSTLGTMEIDEASGT